MFGYALYVSRNIFIDRSDPVKAIESINVGLDRLPPGVGVLFFAEGSRSPDGTIREFKKGGFITALQKSFPILPVTVNGSRKVLPKKSLVFRPGTIEVVVGDPVETSGLTREDLPALMERVRGIIVNNHRPRLILDEGLKGQSEGNLTRRCRIGYRFSADQYRCAGSLLSDPADNAPGRKSPADGETGDAGLRTY
ncbi:MAG: lysophospholipid acyltransferase family protein [Desulfomonilia bacterium]